MFSINDKISIRQIQILLILDIFGTGVIILPRRAAEFASQDGWVVILLSTLAALVSVYIIASLGRLFPEKTFFEYCTIVVGKPVAFVLSILFVTRLILNIAFELRLFGEIVKQTMLYNTPFWVICLCLLIISGYAAAKGYETRARIAEILIFVIFLPLIFVFALACADIDFTNLLPVMRTPPMEIAKGGFYCFSAFTGIELLLLATPYVNNPRRLRKGALQAIVITGIFMTLITLITLSRFGPENIKRQMWPVLEMMDTIDLPGSFIERQEALIMSFWIVSMFAIVNAGLFFSSVILKSVINKGKHVYYIGATIVITFIAAMLPDNMIQVYDIMDFLYLTFGLAYMLIIPAALLFIAKMRGIGEKYENK